MSIEALHHWRGDFVLSRDIATPGERAQLFSLVRRGEYVSIFRGVYVRAVQWKDIDPDGKYLIRLTAAEALAPGSLFSHESAAALWRLPAVHAWPTRAHVIRTGPGRADSTSVFIRHSTEVPQVVVPIGEVVVTGLARTVVDVATTLPFAPAVAMADAALRRTAHPLSWLPSSEISREALAAEVERLPHRHGSARARRVVHFADGAADRPGESLSRTSMHIAHISMPQLQVVLYGASGRRYIVDFWWPEFNCIGEFDGEGKYRDAVFLHGRTPHQAFMDEKDREDDLRYAGHGMTRWRWEVAKSPALLKAHLAKAGVR